MKPGNEWASTRGVLKPIIIGVLLLAGVPARAQDFDMGHFDGQSGEAIYRGICQGCHMPDAQGATGAGTYPRLASDANLAVAGYPVMMVVSVRRAMPAFGRYLDDVQVANVVNYVRTHFGNAYSDKVTPDEVAMVRPVKSPATKTAEHQ